MTEEEKRRASLIKSLVELNNFIVGRLRDFDTHGNNRTKQQEHELLKQKVKCMEAENRVLQERTTKAEAVKEMLQKRLKNAEATNAILQHSINRCNAQIYEGIKRQRVCN